MSFEESCEKVKELKSINQEEQLKLYGLFKQGTLGDNTTARPGMFDQKGRYKWDQWDKQKGISQD